VEWQHSDVRCVLTASKELTMAVLSGFYLALRTIRYKDANEMECGDFDFHEVIGGEVGVSPSSYRLVKGHLGNAVAVEPLDPTA